MSDMGLERWLRELAEKVDNLINVVTQLDTHYEHDKQSRVELERRVRDLENNQKIAGEAREYLRGQIETTKSLIKHVGAATVGIATIVGTAAFLYVQFRGGGG